MSVCADIYGQASKLNPAMDASIFILFWRSGLKRYHAASVRPVHAQANNCRS